MPKHLMKLPRQKYKNKHYKVKRLTAERPEELNAPGPHRHGAFRNVSQISFTKLHIWDWKLQAGWRRLGVAKVTGLGAGAGGLGLGAIVEPPPHS